MIENLKKSNLISYNQIQIKPCEDSKLSNNLKNYKPQNFTSIINNPKVILLI